MSEAVDVARAVDMRRAAGRFDPTRWETRGASARYLARYALGVNDHAILTIARRELDQALALDQHTPEYLVNAASISYRIGDYAAAEGYLARLRRYVRDYKTGDGR